MNHSWPWGCSAARARGVSSPLFLSATTLAPWSCGSPLAVNHVAGDIAPVNKSVSYGTVNTSITGSPKCWITQNLGSSQQATSATDVSEASSGWYWQFNRKQGYQYDGSRLPNTPWVSSITENSDWIAANDPCTQELGSGWRIPTRTEWTAADGAPQNWGNYNHTYASVLKIHCGGLLNNSSGKPRKRRHKYRLLEQHAGKYYQCLEYVCRWGLQRDRQPDQSVWLFCTMPERLITA